MDDRFSIVMPTFRRPHTIFATIATIQAQTYPHWELIVVDNAGDAGYAFSDPRIRLVVHAERTSASHARNQGLGYARGDLVCFFDDDDEMFPDYLEQFARAFHGRPEIKMGRCGMAVGNGAEDYSYATPECCLRRELATPTWDELGTCEDQRYFGSLVEAHGWTEEKGDIVVIPKVLCRAHHASEGGRRGGGYPFSTRGLKKDRRRPNGQGPRR